MFWTDFNYYSKLPFINLDRRAKIIFSIRLVTLLISIIFGAVILSGKAESIPLTVLHTSHSDVAKGLYSALKDTFSGEKSFLTTSELRILAEYISTHTEDTPQVIKCGLFQWCAISYSSSELNYSEGSEFGNPILKDDHHHINKTIECYSYGSNYIFDYRGELSDIGLNIILAYAYTADFETSESKIADSVYVPDESYLEQLRARKKRMHAFIVLLIVSISLQAIMFLSTFFYYGLKGNESNDKKISRPLKHIFAFLSLLNCLLTYAGYIILMTSMSQVQSRVNNELSSYGIYMKFGPKFVTIMVFLFCFATLIFGLWAGPIWFNRSIKDQQVDVDQISLFMDLYNDDEYTDEINDGEREQEENDNDYSNNIVEYNNNYNDDDDELNSTDSFENKEPKHETKVLLRSTPSVSSETQLANPFDESYKQSNGIRTHSEMPFHNSNFLRSEDLFTKRRPPIIEGARLNTEDLIPMSPIMNFPQATTTFDNAQTIHPPVDNDTHQQT